jgi:hypothetical protein
MCSSIEAMKSEEGRKMWRDCAEEGTLSPRMPMVMNTEVTITIAPAVVKREMVKMRRSRECLGGVGAVGE